MSKDTLKAGERLRGGESLTSKNDQFFVTMQTDGNLVVYIRGSGADNYPIWASKTNKACCGGFSLSMQSDNNLVVYSSKKQSNGGAVWATGALCKGKPAYAVMQNDGNFVVYASDRTAIWASGTYLGRKSKHSGSGQRIC